MEIIHVILGKANPDRMNGVNKVVHQLATQQALAGKKVSVWGITKHTTHNYPNRNFDTHLFKAFENKFKLDESLVTELNHYTHNTIFHLHGGFNPVLYSVSKELHRRNIPFVFTPHGAYNEIAMQRSFRMKRLYSMLFEKKLINRASCIHCLGKSEVEGLKKIAPGARAVLVPYGFEMNYSDILMPVRQKLIVGFCGRLDIYTKGLDALLKAFTLLKNTQPLAELWIIGDGNERAKLEKMIASEKTPGIILWGSRYGEEKNALLKQMHLFAHPSRNEGLPSAVLEASALGIPCVVTRATNVGENISKYHCGQVIEQTEPVPLFQAMSELCNQVTNGSVQQMGYAAQQMVHEEYNWGKIIDRFDELYQTAC